MNQKRFGSLLLVALAILAVVHHGLAEDALKYVENEWNFVDGSMDVSNGIPDAATGRLAHIRDKGKLTVATAPSYPPQEFIDDALEGQARFVGADMKLARLIAARMGVELEIVPLDFADVLSGVADRKYDLAISAISFTTSRAAVLEMSKGYYFTDEESSTGLIIREEDGDSIQGVDDLAERDIAAQSGSLQETMASENIAFYHKFRRLPTANDVYEAVMTRCEDVGVVDIGIARIFIDNHPGCGLTIVPDVAFALPAQYRGDRVAAAKGELELIYFVNGVIDEVVASGQYDAWFDLYTGYGDSQD